ncbi:hypothetical protein PFISCL1PPCAC_906, partial [Pristionchus fissidentatus]
TSVVQTRKEEECKTPAGSNLDFGMNECWSEDDDQSPLLSSINAEEGEQQYACRFCAEVYDTNRHLASHIRRKHYKSTPVLKWTRTKQKICRYCKKPFQHDRDRRNHMCRPVFHDPFKTYPCTMCDSQFPSKNAQRTHLKNIHGRMEFICTKCGADFQLKRDMKEHEKTHATAKSRRVEVDQQFKA